jgi:hypothetical protein
LTKLYPAKPTGNWTAGRSKVFSLDKGDDCKTTGAIIEVAVAADNRCINERLFVMMASIKNDQNCISLNLLKIANFLVLKYFNFKVDC